MEIRADPAEMVILYAPLTSHYLLFCPEWAWEAGPLETASPGLPAGLGQWGHRQGGKSEGGKRKRPKGLPLTMGQALVLEISSVPPPQLQLLVDGLSFQVMCS